jgi:high-affinity Fe2+/Pb2+ permease
MGNIFVYSLVAAANASLLAAVTVMLFLPSPKRLLVGYLLGGLLVSLAIGFVLVFVVHQSGATSTTQNSISPAMDIALGLILLVVAYVLRSERIEQRRERKKQEKEGVEKGPSRVERILGKGSARITFVVGVVLTLPGVAYLAALHDLDNLNYGTVPTRPSVA